MTTWAMRKRHEFIRERIDAGEKVNRADLVERFTITKQTATAEFHRFEALYPGVMAYDGRAKAFVRADLVACRPSRTWLYRVRSLLASIRDNEDPTDIVADGGVTLAMVWAQEAIDLLGDGAGGDPRPTQAPDDANDMNPTLPSEFSRDSEHELEQAEDDDEGKREHG